MGGSRSLWAPVTGALTATLGLALVIAACSDEPVADTGAGADPTPTVAELTASGGAATVDNSGANAFAQSSPGLDSDQRRAFVVGNNFFNDNWVTAPASTTARDGLGPMFNAQSCSSCHFKDGRAQPPSDEDPDELGLLLRLSVGTDSEGAPIPHPDYGGQLQDRAINGVPAEGTVVITHEEITGEYADGTTYTLVEPTYTITDEAFGVIAEDTMVSPRIAPPVFGVGLLEAVEESTLEELAEQQAAADDGISGRVNRVWSETLGEWAVGRFGWKANVATVADQTVGAFLGDIGITSSELADQDCTAVQLECLAAPDGGDPELTDSKSERVTFYTRTLAVPQRRDVGEQATDRGAELFDEIGCVSCHVSELETGQTDVQPLSGQTIRPYSDLLLHDMGPGLADGRPDFLAGGSEWRTPPLWGIGLTETVNGHTRFLHDGRARDLTEAILWHGGEAERSKVAFTELAEQERSDLLTFLNSL